MLIRKDTLRAIETGRLNDFFRSAMQYVRHINPPAARDLSDREMLGSIQAAYERALRYGFTKTGPLKVFICLSFEVGPDFDDHPAVKRQLLTADDDGTRIRRVLAHVKPEEWAAAARYAPDPEAGAE